MKSCILKLSDESPVIQWARLDSALINMYEEWMKNVTGFAPSDEHTDLEF